MQGPCWQYICIINQTNNFRSTQHWILALIILTLLLSLIKLALALALTKWFIAVNFNYGTNDFGKYYRKTV